MTYALLHLYNACWTPVLLLLRLIALWSPKTRLALKGRRSTMNRLKDQLKPDRPVVWLHAASLGEYEMGIPVLDEFKARQPNHQVVVSFFSPSGYEVAIRRPSDHLYVYLPWDQFSGMKSFLDILRPELALFVKYEIWPICMQLLGKRGIPSYMISGLFRENQVFFVWYGRLMRSALRAFRHIFVRNEQSMALLRNIGIQQVSVCGDTRFERVTQTLDQLEPLPLIRDFFEGGSLNIVAGSTWPEDEALLLDWLTPQEEAVKLVLAPHEVNPAHLDEIRARLTIPYLFYSELEDFPPGERTQHLREARVLVVDTIGLLRKIYRYAEVAYVGGGFSGKLHNTLEPAVFGIPIVIGPKFHRFPEAVEMQRRKGLFPVAGPGDLGLLMERLLSTPGFRSDSGRRNADYVRENLGATGKIIDVIGGLV